MQQLVLHCGNEIPKILLGNKSDLLDPNKLSEQVEKIQPKIDEIKKEYDCEFFVVSAYTGENVDNAFQYLIQQIYERNKMASKVESKGKSGFKLSTIEPPKDKEKKKCC